MYEHGLNLFQRLTRRWESVHPYNAAQALRIAGRMVAQTATDIWGESLRSLGLGRVRVRDSRQFSHEMLNGELSRYPVRLLPGGLSLEAHLTAELNRRFDDPEEPPFRPFLLQGPDDFYFGIVYQHWVADSVSIQWVLREWFMRAFDRDRAGVHPLRQPREGYLDLFTRETGGRLDHALMASVRGHLRHRRARKVSTAGAGDYPIRVSIHHAAPGLMDRLRVHCREQELKVQDVLLAAMVQACDRFIPTQPRKKRPDLSVGSIMDLRRHANMDLHDTFGLFLGFTHVVCRRQHLRDWPQLLRSIAAQNRGHRQNGLAQASLVWMIAAMALDRFIPDRQLYHFYRKELPMLGGLSNVNLNESWAAAYHPDPLREYLRFSPTGPLVPLVFSTTTFGSRLGLAVTCRDALLSQEGVAEMARMFLGRLDELCPVRTVDNRPVK